MNKIEAVMSRFPQHTYNPEDENSALYKLIRAILDEFESTTDNIDRVNDMLGINTVRPDDIYNRFGALLGIKQNKGETDEQYRNRLQTSVTALSGGTIEAIKYAIACGLGVNNDNTAMDRIHVYDAWKYPEQNESITKEYGYVVCSIDLNKAEFSTDIEEIVKQSADNVKAAGIIIQFIYYNFRVVYYAELDEITYASLSTMKYNEVGE